MKTVQHRTGDFASRVRQKEKQKYNDQKERNKTRIFIIFQSEKLKKVFYTCITLYDF